MKVIEESVDVMPRWTWESETVSEEYLTWHAEAVRRCRREIIQMTHLAASGHPGGSLSSLDFYLVLYAHSHLDPKDPWMPDRDRLVVSHGHTSPGVYSVLARLEYFPGKQAVAAFRRTGNVFEGHIERDVPGVEWTTGNLGQGLSASAGFALGLRLNGHDQQVFTMMGDGEQQKGQIAEARRFIKKFDLNNVTAVIDRNRLQIGGDTDEIMPQDIAAGWRADGWTVHEVDGHDPAAIYQVVAEAVRDKSNPHVIIANTIMGKGFPFMEDNAHWHGNGPKDDDYKRCIEASGDDAAEWDLDLLRAAIIEGVPRTTPEPPLVYPDIVAGEPRTYAVDSRVDNRGAFGNAVLDVAQANAGGQGRPRGFTPIAAFDCDLEGSVKLGAFHEAFPDHFFQSGIQEHHTAACAGALSLEGLATIFADFGVFGVCETYNQHRLSDINRANLKLACTHIGLDVGEDGRTHQCIDYVGVLRNIFGMNIIVPADPNQTDRALRYMLVNPGMFFLGMGRSKLTPISAEDGSPFFAGDYEFFPGRGDWIRRGAAGTVVAMGTLTGRAVEAVDALRADGLDIGIAHLATPAHIERQFCDEIARSGFVVTVEDHSVNTGLGHCLSAALFAHGTALPFLPIGVENYCPSGSAETVYASQGLDRAGIQRRIKEFATKI